jgi:hypothetical protein
MQKLSNYKNINIMEKSFKAITEAKNESDEET